MTRRKKQMRKVYYFKKYHRPPTGKNGPGRVTKRTKNGGVTTLHENFLGTK